MTHSAARPVFTGALCFLSLLLTAPANSLPPGSGVLSFVHNDANGTPQALTSEAGKGSGKRKPIPSAAPWSTTIPMEMVRRLNSTCGHRGSTGIGRRGCITITPGIMIPKSAGTSGQIRWA